MTRAILLLTLLTACSEPAPLPPETAITDAEAGYDQAAYDACIDDAETDNVESCQ